MRTTASGIPITRVDPDLIAARDIVKATLDPDSHKRCHCRDEIDAGQWDRGQKVRATLAGIQYGRCRERLDRIEQLLTPPDERMEQ